MKTYKDIICAVDFSPLSEAACGRAVALARQLGAQLTLLHVVEYFPEDRSNELIAPECDNPAEYRESHARQQLAEFASRLGWDDVPQRVSLSPHAAWHEIVHFAGENNADLIVLGCHGHHGITALLGSTASGVVNHAPCDVIAVRPQA